MRIQEEARRIFQTLKDGGYPWLVDTYLARDEEGRFLVVVTNHLGQSQQVIGTITPHGHRVKHVYRPSSS